MICFVSIWSICLFPFYVLLTKQHLLGSTRSRSSHSAVFQCPMECDQKSKIPIVMNKVQILHLTSKNNELVYVFILSLLKSLLWEMCNFICYPGTHTQIMTLKYIWWNQWLFNMRKNVLHFCTYSPCQVAGWLMYHFLLLQWTSISISEKSVTSKGAIEKIMNKKHSMIYCNRVLKTLNILYRVLQIKG